MKHNSHTFDIQNVKVESENIKYAIWLYFILLIFEGALRKWILPGFSTPLLIVRDPVAIYILFISFQQNVKIKNFYVLCFIIVAIIAVILAILIGHTNWLVALYGSRIFLIHFPLIFIIGKTLSQHDIIKFGRFIITLSIPITFLITLQFYSSQSSWVNLGVGGDIEGAGFAGANGFMRPPATFSFTNGTTLYYSLVTCFICYFWTTRKMINMLLLVISTIMLIIAIPISISRALFFQVIITVLFTIFSIIDKKGNFLKISFFALSLTILVYYLSELEFINTSISAFSSRFLTANEQGGGFKGAVVDRFFYDLISAFIELTDKPFWGYGIGMGTNVGSQILRGTNSFLISEGEWGRLLGELGILLGGIVIVSRLSLGIKLLFYSYRKLKRHLLPWILASLGVLLILQGGWAQPTSLGFCVITNGFLIATLKVE